MEDVDARQGTATANRRRGFSNPDAAINSQGGHVPYRDEHVSATNGCGTEATFAFSSTNPYPNMFAEVYADGWTSFESSGDSAWF